MTDIDLNNFSLSDFNVPQSVINILAEGIDSIKQEKEQLQQQNDQLNAHNERLKSVICYFMNNSSVQELIIPIPNIQSRKRTKKSPC